MKWNSLFSICLLLILLLTVKVLSAQSGKSIQERLQREWIFDERGKVYIQLTKNQFIIFTEESRKKPDHKYFYYLSEEPVTDFKMDQIGKVKNGKYLNYLSTQKTPAGKVEKKSFSLEIIELTDSILKMRWENEYWDLKLNK